MESGTLCAGDVPQGAERAPACLFEVRHHLCDNSKEIVLTYLMPCPSKLDKWGHSAVKDPNSCCLVALFCRFKHSSGVLGTERQDS